MIVGALFLGTQLLASPSVDPSNDTYRYAIMSLRVLGESRVGAETTALRAYCRESAAWQARRQKVDPMAFESSYPIRDAADQCEARSAHRLAPTSPRYRAIFESRWGFPVLAAPFVAVLGTNGGLKCASVLMTMLGGLAAYLILRILGRRRNVAVLGQAFYYASPIGVWGSYGLTDGPSVALGMGILLGAVLVLRRRYRPGISLVGASLLVGCFVRYSSFLVICLAIVGASLLSLLVDRRSRTPMLVLLGLASAGAVALTAAARLFAWPGAGETLQDTFTGHFARPDVADSWGKLLGLNLAYWPQWFQEQLRSPWLLVAVTVGSVMLLRRHRAFGLIGVAVAMTGFLSEVAHPVDNQGDRLMVQVWVAAALGLPLLWRNGNEQDKPRCSKRTAAPHGDRGCRDGRNLQTAARDVAGGWPMNRRQTAGAFVAALMCAPLFVAAPAAANPTGAVEVTGGSPIDLAAQKKAEAVCPAGKRLVGGGARARNVPEHRVGLVRVSRFTAPPRTASSSWPAPTQPRHCRGRCRPGREAPERRVEHRHFGERSIPPIVIVRRSRAHRAIRLSAVVRAPAGRVEAPEAGREEEPEDLR